MSVRDNLIRFLREPADFARGSTDPDIWLEALNAFAIPQLAAAKQYPLREAQIEAWNGLAETRAGLILGPPGTGKTHLLAWLIVGYIQARRARGEPARVFVSAFTRNAIGHLLDSVGKLADRHAPGLFDVRYIGNAPPAGLGSTILHRSDLGDKGADAALADLQADAVVVGGSIWSLTRLTARRAAGGDGHTAELFDLVCIDEASQMVITHGLMAMAGLRVGGRVVVAGDDRQLPPIRASREITLGGRELGGSLYTFLSTAGVPEFALEETFRLNAPLSDFPRRTFYLDAYRSAEAVQDARLDLKPDWRDGLQGWEADLLDPEWPVAIVLHDGPPAATQNPFEADLAARLAGRLADRMPGVRTAAGLSYEFWKESLAIVSPHRAQNAAIRAALPPDLLTNAFVETVDRIQGKERDAVIMSYCVADAEFAVAEADFIFAPERLNVAITRAKTKLIVLVSRRLLEAVPGDQEAMDKAERLREFVFGAAPSRKVRFDDTGQGPVLAELRLRGFDAPPAFDETSVETVEVETPDLTMSEDLEHLLEAVRHVAVRSRRGTADIKGLQDVLATRRDLLPDLSRLHAMGWLNLTESTQYGSYWQARPLDPRRTVYTTDIDTVRARLEGIISQVRTGRAAPFYEPRVRERFAWMNGSGVDVLRPVIDALKAEGVVRLDVHNGSLTVDWVDTGVIEEDEAPEPVPPSLSDADFVVLNALERQEAEVINFGVFESWTSVADLADRHGFDRGTTAAAIGRLAENGWLMLADEGRVRSRMAEQARVLRYVKQRFSHDDADSRPYLVRSLKVELLERDKPERKDDVAKAIDEASEGLGDSHRAALQGLRTMLERRWGEDPKVAGFQARSLVALSQAWSGRGASCQVIAADTGSGKTEAALLPLLAAAAADRLNGVKGVRAILAYPRVRLASNQAQRLAGYLASFSEAPGMPTLTLGLQVAAVPRSFDDLHQREVEAGWRSVGAKTFTFPFFACPVCEQDLLLGHEQGVDGADRLHCTRCSWTFDGWVGSKTAIKTSPPAFFLPTTDSLHQWMHNPEYGRLFGDDEDYAAPRALVADEIHLYSHIHGAQVGYALRRLVARAESASADPGSMLTVGMSATLGDPAEAWGRLIGRPADLIIPRPGEKKPNPRGRECFYFLQPEVESRGRDIAGASTTIQSLMCLSHNMRRRSGAEGGFRGIAFLDSIDKVRRLHSAYDDAETYKKLAALRTRDYPDDPMTGRERSGCCGQPHGCDVFTQGECWWFAANDPAQRSAAGRRRPGAPLGVAEQPVFSGTSGRVEAMIKRSDIVFSTSSLEVGYDDPDINLVYQHYAPRNLASFIQRKGRGGRGVDDRPITGVTLSLYSSRDTWWFRKPQEMISPAGFESPLNPENFFVRRGQLLAATLDGLARTARRGGHADSRSPGAETWAQIEPLVEAVFGSRPWEEFGSPTLEAFWRAALASQPGFDAAQSLPAQREMLSWAPNTLFETVNLPSLTVKTAADREAVEDIGMALGTAAPGNATRRYDGVEVFWRPPVQGPGAWFEATDYAEGDHFALGDGRESWIDHLPIEARPLLTDIRETCFRPRQVTLRKLGKMHGAGWTSLYEIAEGPPVAAKPVGDTSAITRLARHDSRGNLRGFPVVQVDVGVGRSLSVAGLERWVGSVDAYLGGGLADQSTGLTAARVYWGADADVPLSGPPPGSETFTQVFTGPEDGRPMLHGYSVETEGVRYALNPARLSGFVESEAARLSLSSSEKVWRQGQLFRYVLQSRALAAGVNGFDAQRIAELLNTTIAAPDLLPKLKQALMFWDPRALADVLEETRERYLSRHPMLSERQVEKLCIAFGNERGRDVLKAAMDSLADATLMRRYLESATVHSLALRLKDSFVQTARGDERQVLAHTRLALQFGDLEHRDITLCETGAHGDGTARAFVDRFEDAKAHWSDGFLAGCPNVSDDTAVARLFDQSDQHEVWRALDPDDPDALRQINIDLGRPEGDPLPATVLRILYGREYVGGDLVDLYELAIEQRRIGNTLQASLGRPGTAWETISAVVDQALADPGRAAARALAAYAKVEDAALDDSLSPENRLADQLLRLQGSLCADGCRACVQQPSDLMGEGLAQASTSRTLLNRFICEA
ncbi:AAA domain-containing protein [Brevundimonas vancanneytii]